jgi:hypothetical protein
MRKMQDRTGSDGAAVGREARHGAHRGRVVGIVQNAVAVKHHEATATWRINCHGGAMDNRRLNAKQRQLDASNNDHKVQLQGRWRGRRTNANEKRDSSHQYRDVDDTMRLANRIGYLRGEEEQAEASAHNRLR